METMRTFALSPHRAPSPTTEDGCEHAASRPWPLFEYPISGLALPSRGVLAVPLGLGRRVHRGGVPERTRGHVRLAAHHRRPGLNDHAAQASASVIVGGSSTAIWSPCILHRARAADASSSGGSRQCVSVALRARAGPIEHAITDEGFPHEEVLEESAQVGVVRPIFEAQGTAIVQVRDKNGRETLAERVDGSGALAFHDLVVLFILGLRLQALPWQLSAVEVHQDVADRL
mmetsp:Transcript_26926/g.78095  ORF Transcript_26926/g.78095 Transcript_26926/m.78095 type:complete len:231 (-) Transcript_26926:665-1357(-)